MSDKSEMTLTEAQQIIRDPSKSIHAHLFAAAVIYQSPDSTLEDLLVCTKHQHRSIAWQGANMLHLRTGRPQRHDENGWLIIEKDGWEDYFENENKTT